MQWILFQMENGDDRHLSGNSCSQIALFAYLMVILSKAFPCYRLECMCAVITNENNVKKNVYVSTSHILIRWKKKAL